MIDDEVGAHTRVRCSRTGSSNPSPSSGEFANFRSLEMTAGGSMEWQALQNSGPLIDLRIASLDDPIEATDDPADRVPDPDRATAQQSRRFMASRSPPPLVRRCPRSRSLRRLDGRGACRNGLYRPALQRARSTAMSAASARSFRSPTLLAFTPSNRESSQVTIPAATPDLHI
jgi:hypothetical protein